MLIILRSARRLADEAGMILLEGALSGLDPPGDRASSMRQHIARQHRKRLYDPVEFRVEFSVGPQAPWRDAIAAEGFGLVLRGGVDNEGHALKIKLVEYCDN